MCYEEGKEVQQNYEQALYWYKKAAKKNNATAEFNLELIYDNGIGVSKDAKQAVFWYQLSANKHNILTQCNLG